MVIIDSLVYYLNQLKESETRIQGLEKAHNTAVKYFRDERSRRDVTEYDLRKELRVSHLLLKLNYWFVYT